MSDPLVNAAVSAEAGKPGHSLLYDLPGNPSVCIEGLFHDLNKKNGVKLGALQSSLTRECLLAVQASGFTSIISEFQLRSLKACCPGGQDSEWIVFNTVLDSWIGLVNSAEYVDSRFAANSAQTTAEVRGANKKERGSWDALCNTSWHAERIASGLYPAFTAPVPVCDHVRSPSPMSRIQETVIRDDCALSQAEPKNDSMAEWGSLALLESLHSLYEDMRLDMMRWRDLPRLAQLLIRLATTLGQMDFCDHYLRDFPQLFEAIDSLKAAQNLERRQSLSNSFGGRKVPDVLAWLRSSAVGEMPPLDDLPLLLQKWAGGNTAATGSHLCSWGVTVVRLYASLAEGRTKPGESFGQAAVQRLVNAMVEHNFGIPELERLPPGVSVFIRCALQEVREDPPRNWPLGAYSLIGRADLADCSGTTIKAKSTDLGMAMGAPSALPLQALGPSEEEWDGDAAGGDGMEHLFGTAVTSLRFSRDLRLLEVRRLLGSSIPAAVRAGSSGDATDADAVAQQQAQLWQLAQRTAALPLGRAAFTFSTSHAILTEALPIPALVLKGRLPHQNDATVSLDATNRSLDEMLAWPQFHNGVAAGLCLAAGDAHMTPTWIVYNRPPEPSPAHGGVLLALGLQGLLQCLQPTDLYRYLTQEHDETTVGVLLGMAAARRGSMDSATSKMLYLHVPARHPPSFPDLDLPSLVQSAALVAVGLLYQGSAHRLTTEVLLAELQRRSGPEGTMERECYALSAGLALGLVTLGKGGKAWGLADLRLEERLQLCFHQAEQQGAASVRPSLLQQPGAHSTTNGQLLEGPLVNVDVTAPGAMLALAFMYMQTNNGDMAARLAVPNTHYALEAVRPDFMLLRTLARSLILWDAVEASEAWIQAQVPPLVRAAVPPGASIAVACADAHYDVDVEALAQAHVNIVTGGCLAIGLRYAGSCSSDAEALLHNYALLFLREKRKGGGGSRDSAQYHVERAVLETCLCCVLLSLAMVMAGSGHLRTLSLLRYVRRRMNPETVVTYGSHMAVSMALGFLFMGAGARTLGNTPEATAALVIALFPRFPLSPQDNRCHAQALRHLWVLAAEDRSCEARDVASGLPVLVPLQLSVQASAVHQQSVFCRVAPCLLPSRSLLNSVKVCGPRYWPQTLSLAKHCGQEVGSLAVAVQRRASMQTYSADALGMHPLLSFPLPLQRRLQGEAQSEESLHVDNLAISASADPSLKAFARIFCASSPGATALSDVCARALRVCLSSDQPSLSQVLLALYYSAEALAALVEGQSEHSGISNVPLLMASLRVAARVDGGSMPQEGVSLPVVQFVDCLRHSVEDVLRQHEQRLEDSLVEYLQTGRVHSGGGDQTSRLLLASVLHWYSIPGPAAMARLRQQLDFQNALDRRSVPLPILALLLPAVRYSTLSQISARFLLPVGVNR